MGAFTSKIIYPCRFTESLLKGVTSIITNTRHVRLRQTSLYARTRIEVKGHIFYVCKLGMIKRVFILVAYVLKKCHKIITIVEFADVAVVAVVASVAAAVAVTVRIIVACILLIFLAIIAWADVGRLLFLDLVPSLQHVRFFLLAISYHLSVSCI